MGQVSGEYWSQGAKVMGKAQDKPIITMMGLGGSVFLFRLLSLSFCLFILSQHFILGQFRDSVIFVSMGGDSCIPMSFFLLLFLCHFLSFCLHLCSLPFMSSPYISFFRGAHNRVAWVSGWRCRLCALLPSIPLHFCYEIDPFEPEIPRSSR